MKDTKELNIKEMEMVNGGEAMEACEVIEDTEAFDACDAPYQYMENGRLCTRVKKYKTVLINGVKKIIPYYVSEPVDKSKK